jgi:hypothetical protein
MSEIDAYLDDVAYAGCMSIILQSNTQKGVCNMPGGDRKGPADSGPKTGRGLGYCADNDQPGYAANQPGRGHGRGFGRGFGRRGRGRGWNGFARAGEDQEMRGILQQILDKLDKLGS